MARHKGFDQDKVLNKAMNLFWEKGYEATSIQDLEDRMGIGRRSIYDTFNSKYDLFVKTLERYHLMRQRQTKSSIEAFDSPKLIIRAIFNNLIDEAINDPDRKGCLYINSAVELASHDDDIAGRSKTVYQGMRSMFQELLKQAQQSGELTPDLDTLSAAQTLTVTFFGIRVMAKMHPDKEVLNNVVDNSLAFLQ